MDDDEFTPIRDYDTKTPKPDEPKTETEIEQAEDHDALEGDADAA